MWSRFWLQTIGSTSSSTVRAEWLRWLLLAFGLWLMLATRPLWLNSGEFPQVPWFAWGRSVPRQIDIRLLVLGGVALIASGCTTANSGTNRLSLLCFAISLCWLMLLDQHRCQPWAYQWLIISLVLAAARQDLAIGLLRVLTISIYVHSAVSKCDTAFCQGLGQDFWRVLQIQVIGHRPLPGMAGDWWPLLFPLGELVVALGLIWPKSRPWALWMATGMHLVLLYILGPWGLQHSSGVLIWNLFFIVQNWVLFARVRSESPPQVSVESPSPIRPTIGDRTAVILIVWVTIWPLGARWGYCDLWPAWGLYAQHGEHLAVRVTAAAKLKLPPVWQETAREDTSSADGRNWWWLSEQQAALRQTLAPVYPQNRYALGVILAVARDAQIPADQVAATIYDSRDRGFGKSQSVELKSLHEIEAAAARCLWNARPRD